MSTFTCFVKTLPLFEKMSFKTPVAKKSLDGLIVVFVLLTIAASYFGFITPYRQGFHCGDPDLQYKFHGDSISLECLLSLSFILPAFLIIIIEFKRHQPFFLSETTSNESIECSKIRRRRIFWKCCRQIYGVYIQGLVCSIALVEFLKMSIGGLRPHFFDSCKPDFTTINCSQGYVDFYTCTNKPNMPIFYFSDIFKSFPSGHAAIAIYMSLFLCCYIHKQIFPWPTYFSIAMLQTSLIYWACYCSASRILDHRHHWWDVVAGLLLGIVCACYAVIKISLLNGTIGTGFLHVN